MIKLSLACFFWFMGALSTHNFYVSTTSIRFVSNDKTLQITTQVFLDDFESVLNVYGEDKIELKAAGSQEEIDKIVKDYLQKNITFNNGEQSFTFDFLGKIYRNDLMVAYMELKLDSTPKYFNIKNTLFYELLPDQKNIIHLKAGSKRKSFLAVSSKSEFEIPEDFLIFQN